MHLYRKTEKVLVVPSQQVLVCHVLELKGHSAASAKSLKEITSQTEIRLPHNGFYQLEQFRDCCEGRNG